MEPLQLPSEFAQTTKKRFVSIGLPGPTISSHQPGEGSAGDDAACAPGDRPVRIRNTSAKESTSAWVRTEAASALSAAS